MVDVADSLAVSDSGFWVIPGVAFLFWILQIFFVYLR
jgi:hypothetical protein